MKINSISTIDPAYPSRLMALSDAPTKLYYKGPLDSYKVGIAIVGTRKPTAYGRQVTAELSERLAERGAVIISGLAHGIDAIAHEAALKASGQTMAVLACGLDQVYPAAHRGLAERMLSAGGALVSEYTPGTPPLQHRFLERNRLVSGLADVVIVTEAGIRSGTTNTVSHALEQGKDVYVVPGPITSPMSTGCNALIAQGAQPIVTVESFVDMLLPVSAAEQVQLFAFTEEEKRILDVLGRGMHGGDELQKECGLDAALFTQTLTMLEIRGAVKALGANRWSL